MQYKYLYYIALALVISLFAACSDDDDSTILRNDCIKRSVGPNIIGLDIEFAYAIALPAKDGKIVSVQVEATIAGADGTYLENNSYHTNQEGKDIGIKIGEPSTTSGTKTDVTFTKDTCAATLRYYYKVPQEARGKEVSFTFSATASNGEKVTYEMGSYKISKVDMVLDLTPTTDNLCYFSVEDMAFYNTADAASRADRIDLVYLERKIANITFGHAMVSPVATEYLPNMTLPAGVNNNTLIRKEYGLQDRHLARIKNGIYIDDIDFEKINFDNMPNFAINLKEESGIWMQTANGKYRAYIYFNNVKDAKNPTTTVSIKRYTMK